MNHTQFTKSLTAKVAAHKREPKRELPITTPNYAVTVPSTKPQNRPSLPTPQDRRERATREQLEQWAKEDHAAILALVKNGPDAQFARLAEAHDKARARGVLDSYQHTAAAIAAAAAKARAGKADVPAVRDPLAKKIMAAASKAKTKTSHDGPPKDSLAEKIVNAGKNARRPFGE